MTVFPLVSTNNDVYCEVKESYVHRPSSICRNINIQENQTIRANFHSPESIVTIDLISVTADVDKNMMQHFPGAIQLTIFDSNIKSFSLQSDIEHLNVSNSIFPTVSSKVLRRCKKLKSIVFMSNHGLQFNKGAFKHLKALRALAIVNQTIPRIRRRLLKGLENLKDLIFISDKIKEIDYDAFLDLSHLFGLFLDGNPIQSFNVNTSGLMILSRVSLMNTNLKRLNLDVLGSMEMLTSIDLSGQLLKDTNATELATKIPNLSLVGILDQELLCPKVISFVNHLKEKRITVIPIHTEDSSLYKDFIKPSMC